MNLQKYLQNLTPKNVIYKSVIEQNAFLQGFNVCLKKIKNVAPLTNYIIVGVTGKTGSGKTQYCESLTELDVGVCENSPLTICYLNADEIYHLMLSNEEVTGLDELFGETIRDHNGKKNRSSLAKIVFANEENINKLNEAVLPQVSNKIIHMMLNIIEEDAATPFLFVLDAPTLIESGLYNICDSIVFVKADKEVRKQRIMQRDGLTEQQADARMRFEKPDSYYESFADKIVEGV